MSRRLQIILAFVAVFAGVVVHTWFVATGRTSFGYERFTDIVVLVIAGGLGGYTLQLWRRSGGIGTASYVALICVYVLILATHVLRLGLGGLPCE